MSADTQGDFDAPRFELPPELQLLKENLRRFVDNDAIKIDSAKGVWIISPIDADTSTVRQVNAQLRLVIRRAVSY